MSYILDPTRIALHAIVIDSPEDEDPKIDYPRVLVDFEGQLWPLVRFGRDLAPPMVKRAQIFVVDDRAPDAGGS
jgi:hypothetical protein